MKDLTTKPCQCDFCKLSRYVKKTGDYTPMYAYYVAEYKNLKREIENLKKLGYKTGSISADGQEGRLACLEYEKGSASVLLRELETIHKKQIKIKLRNTK